jgi:acetyl esterase/lipase
VASLDSSTDIHALRRQLLEKKRNASKNGAPTTALSEIDRTIATRDGDSITIRAYTAPNIKSGCPVLVVLHGGGWILGGLDNEAPFCRNFVSEFGGISFNVDYRLAPEHRFPTAVYDCYDAVLWVRCE